MLYLLSTLKRVPMCQGFIHTSDFCIILLATSGIRVNKKIFENHLNTDSHVGSPLIVLVSTLK